MGMRLFVQATGAQRGVDRDQKGGARSRRRVQVQWEGHGRDRAEQGEGAPVGARQRRPQPARGMPLRALQRPRADMELHHGAPPPPSPLSSLNS